MPPWPRSVGRMEWGLHKAPSASTSRGAENRHEVSDRSGWGSYVPMAVAILAWFLIAWLLPLPPGWRIISLGWCIVFSVLALVQCLELNQSNQGEA